MPEGFYEVANIEKSVLSAASGNDIKATEKIFTNERTYNRLSADAKKIITMNTAQQISLFDLI